MIKNSGGKVNNISKKRILKNCFIWCLCIVILSFILIPFRHLVFGYTGMEVKYKLKSKYNADFVVKVDNDVQYSDRGKSFKCYPKDNPKIIFYAGTRVDVYPMLPVWDSGVSDNFSISIMMHIKTTKYANYIDSKGNFNFDVSEYTLEQATDIVYGYLKNTQEILDVYNGAMYAEYVYFSSDKSFVMISGFETKEAVRKGLSEDSYGNVVKWKN